MNALRYRPTLLAGLLVVFCSLVCEATSVAQTQPSRALHPLHPLNKNPATNSLAEAWQQARRMKYDPAAWPGVASSKTGGSRPWVATLNTNNWEWLGPGNIGGRTRSILIHPSQPGTMWVGGVGGGVWKSTNNAASFFPCDDWMGSLAISCMALDPTNPDVIYAGTGEGFGNGDSIPGAGVFKSYDGGITWVQLNNFYLNNYNINRLAISPTNNRVILAATSAGIARSTDAGTNWTAPYLSGAILDVAFSPTNGMQCVASGKYLTNSAALYSTNGGTAWMVATGLAATGRIEVAYAPSSPNIVYASQDTNEGTLYISTDGGITYTLRNTGSNYFGTQGYYANCIWVDPTSPSNLVVGGTDLWRSTDGGATLTKISDWALNEINDATVSVHADHHVIVTAPGFDGVTNTTVYFGNDGGLYCTTNIYTATTNVGWLNLDHNLGITQPYGIAANPTTFATIIGSQDTGSTLWTPTNGMSWTMWGFGDGGFCAADPTDPNYFYGEYTYLQIYRSTNAALSENYIFGGIGEAGIPDGYDDDDPDAPHAANFIAPFVLDPNNPNTMLAGGSNLWRSVNVKAPVPTWTSITTNNTNPRLDLTFISAIAVTPGNSDIIWIGYNDAVVYQSTNGTSARPTWIRKSPGSASPCTGLAIDPNNANTVYACFSSFGASSLYRTTDGGTTWTNLSTGLPAAPLHSVVIAPFNSNYIYVGSDLGVFGSADQGITWSPANEGPANVQVLNLAWARNYLLAATHGRGAYRIALGPPTVVLTPASVTNYVGSTASFAASVVGQPSLGFQWTYDGTQLAGANSSTLTLTNLQATNSGRYTLWASNSYGSGSGTVNLAVVDPPNAGLPAVTLTAPASGSSFVALSNILLTASVTTNGHSIVKVLFYNSASPLGESTTPPYQATLSGATAGPHTLLAQAVYDGANVVSSFPVNITVTNLPPTPANDTTNTVPSTSVTIPVLANDTDPYNLPLTIQSVTHPGRGTAVIAGTNVIYTPYDYWFGVDTFNYTVNDGFGATASASITVTTPFPNFTSTYTNQALNLGPVAYWRLNESSGATTFDSAGGHDGTNNGGLVLGTSGPSAPAFPGFEPANTAYQFNGGDTSITFPALNLVSTNITITAWLKSGGSQATNAGIVSWDGTNTFWFGFGSYTNGNINNSLNFERNGFSYSSTLVVPSNQWTFVALVLGPATNTGAFYLATNSTLKSYPISLFSFGSPVTTLFTNTSFLGNNSGHFFNGAMDEVAIFNKSLTASQISDLVAAALTGVPSVNMTSPADGSSLNAASNILLSASVTTNGNHTIDKVQFYDTNSNLLGEAIAPPYTYSWTGMQSGDYSIFARATYDGSSSVDSAAVSLTVTNSVTVSGMVGGLINPGGNPVTISFTGTPGHTFEVQRSTNLVDWATILTTNAPPGGTFISADNFSDLGGPPPYAFYRLSWAP